MKSCESELMLLFHESGLGFRAPCVIHDTPQISRTCYLNWPPSCKRQSLPLSPSFRGFVVYGVSGEVSGLQVRLRKDDAKIGSPGLVFFQTSPVTWRYNSYNSSVKLPTSPGDACVPRKPETLPSKVPLCTV